MIQPNPSSTTNTSAPVAKRTVATAMGVGSKQRHQSHCPSAQLVKAKGWARIPREAHRADPNGKGCILSHVEEEMHRELDLSTYVVTRTGVSRLTATRCLDSLREGGFLRGRRWGGLIIT